MCMVIIPSMVCLKLRDTKKYEIPLVCLEGIGVALLTQQMARATTNGCSKCFKVFAGNSVHLNTASELRTVICWNSIHGVGI
jgi:hypothetical protein